MVDGSRAGSTPAEHRQARTANHIANAGLLLLIAFAWGSQKWPEYSASMTVAALLTAIVGGGLTYWLSHPGKLSLLSQKTVERPASDESSAQNASEGLSKAAVGVRENQLSLAIDNAEATSPASKWEMHGYGIAPRKHTHFVLGPETESCTVQVGMIRIHISGQHTDIKVGLDGGSSRPPTFSKEDKSKEDKIDVVLMPEEALQMDYQYQS
jgi:hypothetical protein